MRASLLAAAVSTTLIGARVSNLSSHGPNGDRSRLTRRTADRAPCTRSLRRYRFPRLLMPNSLALRVLPRHKPQPGGELAALVEGCAVADRSHDRGCHQRADTGDLS